MTEGLHYIIPQRTQATAEVFAVHQLAWEFRCEREARHARQRYCQWYRETARQHQAEYRRLQQQAPGLQQCLVALARALPSVWQQRRQPATVSQSPLVVQKTQARAKRRKQPPAKTRYGY